jgi:uncharacterized protein
MAGASMATNGVRLTPRLAEQLSAAGLKTAQITFDGSRADHDQIRVKRSGAGTFDTIVNNMGRAAEVTDLTWHIRVNVSHHNFDRLGDLFGELEHRIDPSRCVVNFAWVGDAGFGYDNGLERVDRVSLCSTPGGRHGAVVNADGTLYSCWQSAGKAGYEVGTIDDGYLDESSVADRWVTCGYEYEQPDPELAAAFQDRVDGQLLDYLYETGRI